MEKREEMFQSLVERAALGYQCLDESGNMTDTDSGPVKQTLEKGAKGFVSKPFQMKQLLHAVRKVLNEKL